MEKSCGLNNIINMRSVLKKIILSETYNFRYMNSLNLEIENAILLYFTSPDCNLCKSLIPKIREMVASKFPQLKLQVVDIASNKEIAGKYQIFTVPVILVFFEGKEFLRKVRNFSISELEKEIDRPYQLFFH